MIQTVALKARWQKAQSDLSSCRLSQKCSLPPSKTTGQMLLYFTRVCLNTLSLPLQRLEKAIVALQRPFVE
jgi:hypothetical protein